jgi:hypothetical protein
MQHRTIHLNLPGTFHGSDLALLNSHVYGDTNVFVYEGNYM